MNNTTYLIVPYAVYTDERLNHFDKLLYGKIYSLSRYQGYCWASNSYLAEEQHVSESYVSKAIKRLRDCGYVEYTFDNSVKNEFRRRIYINYETLEITGDKTKNIDEGLTL